MPLTCTFTPTASSPPESESFFSVVLFSAYTTILLNFPVLLPASAVTSSSIRVIVFSFCSAFLITPLTNIRAPVMVRATDSSWSRIPFSCCPLVIPTDEPDSRHTKKSRSTLCFRLLLPCIFALGAEGRSTPLPVSKSHRIPAAAAHSHARTPKSTAVLTCRASTSPST